MAIFDGPISFPSTRSHGDMSPAEFARLVEDIGGGTQSTAGVTITTTTALRHWAFAASVRFISSHFAALPVFPYRRIAATDQTPAGKERMTSGSLFHMLHDEADAWTTQPVWAEASMMHCLTSKGCFSEIQFNDRGEAVALHLITPDRVTPKWVRLGELGSQLFYEVAPPAGLTGTPQMFPDWQIFHVPSDLPWDGLNGSVVTDYGRDTIGTGRAAEISAAKAFKNGGMTMATIDVPETIDPTSEKFRRLKKLYDEGHAGLSNQWRHIFNVAGVKYNPVQMDAKASQLLESRQLSAAEIAGLMGLDPSLIGAANPGGSSVTYASAESRIKNFYVSTLRPKCRRFKMEFQKKLVPARQRGSIIIDYVFDDLAAMDVEVRTRVLIMQKNAGLLTVDEARAIENRPPLPKPEPAPAPAPPPQPEDTPAPEPAPVRAMVRCKDAITDASARQLRVFEDRLAKQTDDTRAAFIEEQGAKIRSALLPLFHVYAELLDGDDTADELAAQHVAALLKEHTNG